MEIGRWFKKGFLGVGGEGSRIGLSRAIGSRLTERSEEVIAGRASNSYRTKAHCMEGKSRCEELS